MKGIPPEIDALLWQLAEEGGSAARAEFETRHARYGPELARRIRMVAELKEAGRLVAHRPAFTPRPPRTVPMPRWAVGGALGLGVLAIGAVAYVVASSGERLAAPPVPPSVATQPVSQPPRVVYQKDPDEPKPTIKPQEPKDEPKPTVTPKYLVARDVRIADTSLTSAIELVAAGGGLEVTVAPGFKDKKVSLDYRGLNTIDTLKAMGEENGFTVLEEQEGHVLVVPARDEASIRPLGP